MLLKHDHERSKLDDVPLLCPRSEAIGYFCGLGVAIKEILNVETNVSVGFCEFFCFEWLPNEMARLPLFKGVAVLWVDLGLDL